MTTPTAEPSGRVSVPADDPGVLASVVVGAAVLDVRRQVAERVGLTGDEPLPVVLAALDQALAARADTPPGSVLVDASALAELQADAAHGRTIERGHLIAAAINTGRMRPADRAKWDRLLTADYPTAAAMIRALPITVPLSPRGYGTEPDHLADDTSRLLTDIFGDEPT